METQAATAEAEAPVAEATETIPATLALSATAAAKVSELLKQEGNPEYFLRLAVQPGGCSGLRYAIYFDDRQLEGDVVDTFGDVTVRVDRMSAPYLRGATLDWLETLQASGFTIQNPNAHDTCACGDSFH
jgi:iron-sulfur cluster assembly accessory protein